MDKLAAVKLVCEGCTRDAMAEHRLCQPSAIRQPAHLKMNFHVRRIVFDGHLR